LEKGIDFGFKILSSVIPMGLLALVKENAINLISGFFVYLCTSHLTSVDMSDRELKTYLSELEKAATAISKDKEKSIKFLKDIGMLNREGKVKRQFRSLCIPIGQD